MAAHNSNALALAEFLEVRHLETPTANRRVEMTNVLCTGAPARRSRTVSAAAEPPCV